MILQRTLKNFDWLLLGGFSIIATASLLTLGSSGTQFFSKQLLWYGVAFFIILSALYFDWRVFLNHRWFRQGLYWISIALLLISSFQDFTIRGTKSWLVIGGFQFEPVELTKLALIFIFAHFFSRRHLSASQGKNILFSFGFMILPVGIVMMQPDFGSALVMISLWIGFLLMSGIKKKRLLVGSLICVLMGALIWSFVLKPYQKNRIVGFITPQNDPLGINYNVIQSKIAIGSAGFLGKGFGGGTQTHLKFLPEAQTDFLFAAFIEEWGILGGIMLLLTFFLILSKLVTIGLNARDNFERLIIMGVWIYFLVHFFVNVGSNVGLTPVAGIPFPFFTYGGSHILTTAVLVSIIERIKLGSSI